MPDQPSWLARVPALEDALAAASAPGLFRPEPGQLSVRFDTAEDLVEKLFTLGQALANDYESLEAALAGTEGSQDHHGSG